MVEPVMCKECIYWEDNGRGAGECRRNAPQAIILSKADLGDTENDDWPTHHASWPVTIEEDWCAQGKRGRD